jgi:hypothetical protein
LKWIAIVHLTLIQWQTVSDVLERGRTSIGRRARPLGDILRQIGNNFQTPLASAFESQTQVDMSKSGLMKGTGT